MKYVREVIIIVVCGVVLYLANTLQFGKFINNFFPCTQSVENSFPCYGVYDLVIMALAAGIGIFTSLYISYRVFLRRK